MTILVMFSFVIAGAFGYKQLPVAAVPRVEFPTIQVTAQLPGASPETMAASVASILERQFSTIAGVTTMTSTSSLGNTSISTARSMAPRSTFSRPSPRPCAACRPSSRRRPASARSIRRTTP
jgi:hypothetical protein